MSDILLTIGIPTYNGSLYIEETIKSVLSQMSNLDSSEFEILIVDNKSNDSTFSIASQLQQEYSEIIRVFQNDENLGYDRNVNRVVELARGRFVFFLGDDDYFVTDYSLKSVVGLLKENPEIKVLHFAYKYLDVVTGAVSDGTTYCESTLLLDGDSFIMQAGFMFTTLSSLIVKRDDWLRLDLTPFFGSSWIQVAAILRILRTSNNSLIFNEPVTVVRISRARWIETFGALSDLKLKLIEIFSEMKVLGYSPHVYRDLKNRFYNELMFLFLSIRSKSFYYRARYFGALMKFFWNKPGFWLFGGFLIFSPQPIITLARLLKKKFFIA